MEGQHQRTVWKGLGCLVLCISILAAAILVAPFSLATIGFSAIVGAAGGLDVPTAATPASQPVQLSTNTAPAAAPQTLGPFSTDGDLTNVSALLNQARAWLGTRYVFGGCSRAGIDCSCFVQTIFGSIDINLPRTSQLQYNATVGRGLGTSSPQAGDLVFFFRTYPDPGQDWTHVGVVSRVDSNGVVWMIDAPGARAAGDPPDAPFGRVREEPIAGSWLQHTPTFARIPIP
jgi:hypothetical protein